MQIKERIKKDINMFYDNLNKIDKLSESELKVVELSKMYASDAQSYLEKEDMYTSFSCISYAHGLLDAVIAIKDIKPVE